MRRLVTLLFLVLLLTTILVMLLHSARGKPETALPVVVPFGLY